MRARIFAEENRKWWTLGAVAFGLFMIMLDNTVVFVALSSIQTDLHISTSELEWVVNGYALTFAVLMLTGGKLADLLGRRLIFIVGLAIFTASSLACGLATSAAILIGARVVQGVGSALFIVLELRQRVPMLDLSFFKNPSFAGANTVMLLVALAMFGVFFFNSLYLQRILHYSAIQTGATFLPMTVLIVLLAPVAG